jgi:hypothetical protein
MQEPPECSAGGFDLGNLDEFVVAMGLGDVAGSPNHAWSQVRQLGAIGAVLGGGWGRIAPLGRHGTAKSANHGRVDIRADATA